MSVFERVVTVEIAQCDRGGSEGWGSGCTSLTDRAKTFTRLARARYLGTATKEATTAHIVPAHCCLEIHWHTY